MKAYIHRLCAVFVSVAVVLSLLASFGSGLAEPLPAEAAFSAFGVDVSKFQEEIDWKAVAEGGAKFAIIRCCKVIRAYDDWEVDSRFEENYKAAKEAGLAVGCYMFTDAATTEEFTKDVEYMLTFLDGKSFDFPVFLDLESSTRQEHLPSARFMPALLTGLELIEDAGFTAGVYSSFAFFRECIDPEQLREAGYAIWEANYFNTTNGLSGPEGHNLSDECVIWQYSGNGHTSGIKTKVDCNICYSNSYFTHEVTLMNSSLPYGTMRYGTGFTVAGTVSSQSVVRTLTGAIYAKDNPRVPLQEVTVKPHAREYKLTGFFTKRLVFSQLRPGEYVMRITAVDASDTKVTVAEADFEIAARGAAADHSDGNGSSAEEYIGGDYGEDDVPVIGPAAQKKSSRTSLRVAAWMYDHWPMRKLFAALTKMSVALKLERTPFYRIVSACSHTIEVSYLAATIGAELETEPEIPDDADV